VLFERKRAKSAIEQGRRQLSRLASSLSFAVVLTTFAGAAQAAAEEGWVIKQNSHAVGKTIVYLTPHAMKFVNVSDGAKVVMKAPDWRVYLFRENPKVCYTTPCNKFESHQSEYINRWHGEEMTDLPWAARGVTSVHGQDAVEYRRLGAHGEEYTNRGRQRDYIGVRDARYMVSRSIPITGEECRVLNNLFNTPNTHKYPLTLTFRDEEGLPTLELTLLGVEKKLLADTEFKTPGNEYKIVNDEREVFVSPSKQDAIDSMSKLLGTQD
jgi:hypothetical protein